MVKRLSNEKRRTIWAPPSYAATRDPGLYAFMFVEDIRASFLHMTRNPGERTVVEGDEAGRSALESICASLSDYPGRDLAQTVQSAIESIAGRLAWFGEAFYEICGRGADISLASVVPRPLFRIPGGFIQFVPGRDLPPYISRRWAFLPANYAWAIQLPRTVGGPRAYRRLLNELTAVSKPAPEFWTRELERGKISTEFVLSDYNRTRDAYIARLTRRWGWNRRDASGTQDTQFFYFFRSIRFQQAHATVRDHVVDEMNKLLLRLRINARVRLEGFRSPAEIEDLIRRSLDGSLHYAEALRLARGLPS